MYRDIRSLPLTGPAVRALTVVLFLGLGVVQATFGSDYEQLDELLLQNVQDGFVNYDGLRADPRFKEVVQRFASVSPADIQSENERLAFYINTYNILSIQSILDGYSPANFFGRVRFFKLNKFPVLNEKINLYDLEHEHIIPMDDPRIHFAIVCASLSCPRLSNRAYTPDEVDYQLHDAARQFVNDPTRNRFDAARGIAFLSMIFKWYRPDFEAAGGTLQRYLARFVDDPLAEEALRKDELEIRYEEYDWSLNGHLSTEDQ